MTSLINFYGSRVIYDMTEYTEADFTDRVVLCVPRFAWLQARNLMRGYGLRLNAYAREYTNMGYYPPDAALFDKIDESISDFLGERDMCQELTEAINNLALAFEAGCCGNGSFGAGEEEPPASSQPDEEGDFPAGFDTYAEYRAYKCDIANRIVEGIKEDMDWIGAADLAQLTVNGLLTALLTPIPFSELLSLVGYMVALFIQTILGTTADAVSADIDANRETLVCLLYDAVTATQAKADVLSYMSGLLTATELALFTGLWTFASVNALFEKTILLEASPLPNAVSCDGCTSECTLCIATNDDEPSNGVYTIISPVLITMTSGLVAATHWGICDFNTDPATNFFCGPPVELSSYVLLGFTPWATSAYRLYDHNLVLVYNSSTPPDWSLYTSLRRIQLKSSTSFTGTINLV